MTPEYNHSVPGELKNALDNVFVSNALRNKPVGFVGYSGSLVGGARAVEHLAHIAIEADMASLRNSVLVPAVQSAFDGDEPTDPLLDARLQIVLDDLVWWGSALQQARAAGELPPGNARLMAAMSAMKG